MPGLSIARLDPFQACALLRLLPVSRDLLREFQPACLEEGVTPLDARWDFRRDDGGESPVRPI